MVFFEFWITLREYVLGSLSNTPPPPTMKGTLSMAFILRVANPPSQIQLNKPINDARNLFWTYFIAH